MINQTQHDYSQLDNHQSFSINQLYEEVKRAVYQLTEDKKKRTGNTFEKGLIAHDFRLLKVKKLFIFVVKKLTKANLISKRQFIGYLSIFCYLIPSAKTYQFSLNFQMNFYRNITNFLIRNIQSWKEPHNEAQEHSKKLEITTLLFLVTNFSIYAEEQKKQSSGINIKWSKIFNSKVVSIITCCEWPVQNKIMKYFRTLMLFFINSNPKNLSASHFFNSVCSHLIKPTQSQETKVVLLYILNKLELSQLNQIPQQKITAILKVVKQQLMNPDQANKKYYKLYLNVLSKIEFFIRGADTLLEIKLEQIFIICENLKNPEINYTSSHSQWVKLLHISISKFSGGEKMLLAQKLTENLELPTQYLQLIFFQACFANVGLEILGYIMESKLWMKISEELIYHKKNFILSSQNRLYRLQMIYKNLMGQNINNQIKFLLQSTFRVVGESNKLTVGNEIQHMNLH